MSELQPGDEVELAPGFDHLYNPDPMAGRSSGVYVGCKAKVRDKRDDSVGFPHVFVEWDKEDWRYGGMPDGWTYESHFRKAKPLVTEPQDNTDLIIKGFVDKAKETLSRDSEPCEGCGQIHFDPDRNHEFISDWMEAEGNALTCEGYAVISVHRDYENDNEDYAVFDGRVIDSTLTDDAMEALEQQIINLAAKIILSRSKRGPR